MACMPSFMAVNSVYAPRKIGFSQIGGTARRRFGLADKLAVRPAHDRAGLLGSLHYNTLDDRLTADGGFFCVVMNALLR